MLATLVPEPFDRPGWVFEEKYDGIRAIAYRRGKKVSLFSRNLKDLAKDFPDIARAMKALPGRDVVLDGEIVAFDGHGVSRFQLLQRRALGEPIAPVFAAFDCLARDGASLLSLPLRERRRALETVLLEPRAPFMVARRLTSGGLEAYRTAQREGWEGIIAKDDASPYEPGRRSRSWLKVKSRQEAEFVIGGYTSPEGRRAHFGALLLGLYEGPRFQFVGKVGTGFSSSMLVALAKTLRTLRTASSPFRPPPPERHVTWVRPKLVAQVAFAEWTADGKLRQPVFLGLRQDKKPTDVRCEH